ncbi:D-alanyl-D-alanine carboxypeptidase family protein [Vagococcus fluvialis]|uniref:D-alanyl-D-alanine carboxypeptidase family protein n=1 Tax=Vagococcus fluvialis TaxID=2738 RepID=UPI003D0B5B5E
MFTSNVYGEVENSEESKTTIESEEIFNFTEISTTAEIVEETIETKEVEMIESNSSETSEVLETIGEEELKEPSKSSIEPELISLYGTVISKNYPIWEDINFKEENGHSSNYHHQTLSLKSKIEHSNGSTYYELYDNQNQRLGFINGKSLSISESRGGIYLSNGSYGTIKKKNYSLWNDFTFKKERNNTSQYYEQTLHMRGEYHHFNGSIYYSVYDNKNNWLGYLNQSAVTIGNNRGGTYISNGNYGTVVKKNYPLWQDLGFKKERNNSTKFYEQTFQLRGEYHHFNGTTYYSVYDNKNNWLGYINQNGVKATSGKEGVAIKTNNSVALPNNNYQILQNFSWKEKNNTNRVAKKKYLVKYKYNHFNGSTYDSLYDGNNWSGYINHKGTRKWDVRNGVTYIDNIMIANKKISLPSTFNPGEDREAGNQARKMISDMQKMGMNVSSSYSGFRTYQYQKIIFDDYVKIHGQAKAETFSARPGHSEHQTGLTFDLRHSNGTLIEYGREANWLATNSHKYGFIIR